MEPFECRHAMGSDQVVTAPAVFGFERQSIMTARLQFTQDATEEMRIAVIPVGHQRMGVENEAHAALSAVAMAGACAARAAAYTCRTCIHLPIGRE